MAHDAGPGSHHSNRPPPTTPPAHTPAALVLQGARPLAGRQLPRRELGALPLHGAGVGRVVGDGRRRGGLADVGEDEVVRHLRAAEGWEGGHAMAQARAAGSGPCRC